MALRTGGIGNSYVLTATCALSTAGQLPYLPDSYNLSTLGMPIAVQKCGQGTEQQGSSCKECALNTYDFDGLTCLACPYGK